MVLYTLRLRRLKQKKKQCQSTLCVNEDYERYAARDGTMGHEGVVKV